MNARGWSWRPSESSPAATVIFFDVDSNDMEEKEADHLAGATIHLLFYGSWEKRKEANNFHARNRNKRTTCARH